MRRIKHNINGSATAVAGWLEMAPPFCLPPLRRRWMKGWAGEQGQQERTLRIACEDEEEAEAFRQLLGYIHSAGRTLPHGGCCSASALGWMHRCLCRRQPVALVCHSTHCTASMPLPLKSATFSFGWPCRYGRDHCSADCGAQARR